MLRSCILLILLTLLFALPVLAESMAPADSVTSDINRRLVREKRWAVGAIFRTASIPFVADESTVATFVPLIHYEGDTFFFRSLEGGFKIYRTGDWQFSALGRLRFFDIPEEYQNEIQEDQAMWGAQARYAPFGPWYLDLEPMTDSAGRLFANARLGARIDGRRWVFSPFFQAQFKTKKFNDRYYGLDREGTDAGTELSLGFTADYHVVSNVRLFLAGDITRYDNPVRHVSFIDKDFHFQGYLGVGLTNDKSKPVGGIFLDGAYVRLAQGWATPSSLADILNGNAEDDPYNNKMTSVFYGHPLSKTLFGLPIHVFLHSGLVYHWKSEVQDSAIEGVVSIKIYYTIPLPWRIKLGAAEGLSWVNKVPYVETTELAKKGYETSNLLNFLDFSADINIGDIVRSDSLRQWWFGYSIHHRSAIFETAQQFGRIKGGSNFQTLYLQRDF